MAAGLGFKTFTTGEVLTAADTNGYLMQGILVFASAAARAAAITSPQEGQYSYLKDTNSTEYYDGAAWIAAPIGDITGVTAGTGISGGGTSGTVTITNSMATEIAAKGDLIVGTGAATFDNLTVGANGTTLVADSTASTGLKWETPSSGGLTYAAWTPTTTGITAGNGTTVARYAQSGKFVTGSYNFTLGSTSAITSGGVSFTLPVTAKAAFVLSGDVTFLRTGVGYEIGKTLQASTTVCYVGALGASTTYGTYVDVTALVPHTWGNGDFISLNFSYEAA